MIGIDDVLLTVAPDALKGIVKAIPNAIDKARFKSTFGSYNPEKKKGMFFLMNL